MHQIMYDVYIKLLLVKEGFVLETNLWIAYFENLNFLHIFQFSPTSDFIEVS